MRAQASRPAFRRKDGPPSNPVIDFGFEPRSEAWNLCSELARTPSILDRLEAVRAAPSINVAVIFEHISAETAKLYKHVEKQSCLVAEAIGEETGRAEKTLRKEVEASATRVEERLHNEMRQGFARNATELMRLRELRESAQNDMKLQMVTIKEEMLALRQELFELRNRGTTTAKSNGGEHYGPICG